MSKSTAQTPTFGDPIDVTTGRMFYTRTDVRLPGLILQRTHRSDYRWGRSFGPSWASTLDQRIVVDGPHAHFLAADGSVLTYPIPAEGAQTIPVLGRIAPLLRLTGGGWLLADGPARLLFAPATPEGESLLSDVWIGAERWTIERSADGTPRRLCSLARGVVDLDPVAGRITVARWRPAVEGETEIVELAGFAFDARGELAAVRNSSGDAERFRYDDAGRMVRWDDRNGEWYTYRYDHEGRCVLADGNGGYLRCSFAYAEGVTLATDSLGAVHRFEINERHQVTAVVDPLGAVTRMEWDTAHRRVTHIDALGRVTRLSYDRPGQLTMTFPDGCTTTIRYDADGHAASWTGAGGRTHEIAGRAGHQPAASTSFDSLGRRTRQEQADGTATAFGWTVEGDLAWRRGPDGHLHEWHYDGEGNLVESIDAQGRAVSIEYGPFDLPIARVDEAGNRTIYAYDTELRLTSITNPAGQSWYYVYDAAGRTVEETDFDGRTQRYAYDAAGQLVVHTDALGTETHYAYDVRGRVVERRTGSACIRLEYDADGGISAVVSPDATVRFERDGTGRIIAESIDGRAVRTVYHETLGAVASRTTPSGRVSRWSFDAEGRPIDLLTGGHRVRFGYDLQGREISRDVDGVRALRQTFDVAGRLAVQQIAGTAERAFTYDDAGRIVAIADSAAGDRTFQADPTGRIHTVAGDGAPAEKYEYDTAGNLAGAGGERWHLRGSLLERAGTVGYAYDGKGRLVSRTDESGIWQFSWDAWDNLAEATTPEGVRWRYRYDGFGRRISKQRLTGDGTVAESVDFAWAGDLLVEQSRHAGVGNDVTMSWDHHPDSHAPVTQAEDRELSTVVTDVVGTPTHLVAADGALRWWPWTELWGGAAAVLPPATPLRFPGQYHDAETGLHYNRFRYYDPAAGRYVSADPLGLSGGPNPTAYVPDPLNWADPLGLTSCRRDQGSPSAVSSPRNPFFAPGGPTMISPVPGPPTVDPTSGTARDDTRHRPGVGDHGLPGDRLSPSHSGPAVQDSGRDGAWYSDLGQTPQTVLASGLSPSDQTYESLRGGLPSVDNAPRTGGRGDEAGHSGEPTIDTQPSGSTDSARGTGPDSGIERGDRGNDGNDRSGSSHRRGSSRHPGRPDQSSASISTDAAQAFGTSGQSLAAQHIALNGNPQAQLQLVQAFRTQLEHQHMLPNGLGVRILSNSVHGFTTNTQADLHALAQLADPYLWSAATGQVTAPNAVEAARAYEVHMQSGRPVDGQQMAPVNTFNDLQNAFPGGDTTAHSSWDDALGALGVMNAGARGTVVFQPDVPGSPVSVLSFQVGNQGQLTFIDAHAGTLGALQPISPSSRIAVTQFPGTGQPTLADRFTALTGDPQRQLRLAQEFRQRLERPYTVPSGVNMRILSNTMHGYTANTQADLQAMAQLVDPHLLTAAPGQVNATNAFEAARAHEVRTQSGRPVDGQQMAPVNTFNDLQNAFPGGDTTAHSSWDDALGALGVMNAGARGTVVFQPDVPGSPVSVLSFQVGNQGQLTFIDAHAGTLGALQPISPSSRIAVTQFPGTGQPTLADRFTTLTGDPKAQSQLVHEFRQRLEFPARLANGVDVRILSNSVHGHTANTQADLQALSQLEHPNLSMLNVGQGTPNCIFTTRAYELGLRTGQFMPAGPVQQAGNLSDLQQAFPGGQPSWHGSAQDAIAAISGMSPGTRGAFGYRVGPPGSMGHMMSFRVDNHGQITILDAQSGTYGDLPPLGPQGQIMVMPFPGTGTSTAPGPVVPVAPGPVVPVAPGPVVPANPGPVAPPNPGPGGQPGSSTGGQPGSGTGQPHGSPNQSADSMDLDSNRGNEATSPPDTPRDGGRDVGIGLQQGIGAIGGGRPSFQGIQPDAVAKSTVETPTAADPIDVTTGRMILTHTDAVLPGLTLERTYRSDYLWGRSFGSAWAATLDQRIVTDGDLVRYLAADGSILTYALPAEGDEAVPAAGRVLTLRRLVGGGWLVSDPESGRSLLFDQSAPDEALLSDVVDGNIRWSIDRDAQGTPEQLRSSTGAVLGIGSSAGLVTELALPTPAGDLLPSARFGYDWDRNLVQVTNSSGDAERFTYVGGRIVRWDDRNGEWYAYTYDESGRCVATDGKGGYLAYTFNYGDGLTVATDSLGGATRYEINEHLQVVAQTDPLGATTHSTWDDANRLLSRTDPLGRTTRYEYDSHGRRTAIVRADGSRSSIVHDALGRAVSWTDFDGSTRHREFDADGRVLAETDPHGDVVRFDLPAPNGPGTMIQAGGTVIVRNAARQVISEFTGDVSTRYRYDPTGRVVRIESDAGITDLAWTLEGELARRRNPDGSVEEFWYDGEGNLVEAIDAAGRRTLREYGAFDLLTARIDDEGNRTEYAYDTELRLITVTDALGGVRRYVYDAAGRLAAETDAAGRTQRYAYDAAGQLVTHTDATGASTHFTYDVLGRVTERRTGEDVVRIAYDAAGRIVAATDGTSEVRLQRDALGRVVAETVNGRTVATTYGEQSGVVTAMVRPSGTATGWSYDDAGRPAVLTAAGEQFRFGRDEDRRTAVPRDMQGIPLVPAAEDDARYLFDLLGRPVSRTVGSDTWQLTWDRANRLTGAVAQSGDRWVYRYDALGRRSVKQRVDDAGTVTEEITFVWSGDLLVEQHHRAADGRTTTTAWEYHPLSRDPVAQIKDGVAQVVVIDAGGAPTEMAGLDGTRVGGLDGMPLRARGRYFDAETGLLSERSKVYDPVTARYLPASAPVR